MSTLSTLEPADPPLLEAAHLSRVAGGPQGALIESACPTFVNVTVRSITISWS